MIRSHVLHLTLAVVGACACACSTHAQIASVNSLAVAQVAQSGPISPKLEKNQASHMKVQLLNRSGQETTYAVIFGKGDEVMAGLTEFAQEKHIGAARVTGIGGVEDATLGYFDRQSKKFRTHSIGQSEVLSLLGDIAVFQGKPVVHVHMVVGFPDGSAHGGHLLKAHVWPTLEVIVTQYPNAMQKKVDAATGLVLIDPSEKQ